VQVTFLDISIEKEMGAARLALQHLKIIKALRKQCRVTEQAILLGTNPLFAFCWYAALGRNKKVQQIISTEHFSITEAGVLSKCIRKCFYRGFTVVTLTDIDLEYIVKTYHPKRTVCIPNAIPFEPKGYVFDEDKKTIIALGRLTPQKGFDLLIESFSLIAHKYEDWNLLIVGNDYGEKRNLQDLIEERGLVNVAILPAVTDVQPIYEQASFYVMSSRFEGFPMVLLEALGFGLPIVAFDCPTGPRQMVGETNGILVENGNITKLALAMESLMTNQALLLGKAKGAEEKAVLYTKNVINRYWDEII